MLACLGDTYFQRDRASRLVETYREIRLLEKCVDEGVNFAPARLTQAKMNSGFSFGECGLLKIVILRSKEHGKASPHASKEYRDHKKDMWGGFYTSSLVPLLASNGFADVMSEKMLAGVAIRDG